MYDAIVVGARCAGSPTAMLLARKGYGCCCSTGPASPATRSRPTTSTSPAWPASSAGGCWTRWWPRTARRSRQLTPRRRAVRAGRRRRRRSTAVADAYAPRRTRPRPDPGRRPRSAAGAELREHFAVDGAPDRGRVAGDRACAATRVGGATGDRAGAHRDRRRRAATRWSRAAVDAPVYDAQPALTCAYYTYWSGVADGGRRALSAPGPDDRGRADQRRPDGDDRRSGRTPNSTRVRADIEGHFLRALELAPELAERGARRHAHRALPRHRRPAQLLPPVPTGRAGRWSATPATTRTRSWPWASRDAFRDAELLADAVDAGLSGRSQLDAALAELRAPARRERCAAASDDAATSRGCSRRLPEMQQLFAALRDDQAQTDRFFGTVAGTVHPSEFFAPENLASIGLGASVGAAA